MALEVSATSVMSRSNHKWMPVMGEDRMRKMLATNADTYLRMGTLSAR